MGRSTKQRRAARRRKEAVELRRLDSDMQRIVKRERADRLTVGAAVRAATQAVKKEPERQTCDACRLRRKGVKRYQPSPGVWVKACPGCRGRAAAPNATTEVRG